MNDPLPEVEAGGYGLGDGLDVMGGDGLDDFLPQEDEGKYGSGEDDIFAGTDMAGESMGQEDLLSPVGIDASLEVKEELEVEESKLGNWENEHRKLLMEKRNAARAKKEELLEKAKTDIEKFYKERQEKKENARLRNKDNEKKYFQDMTDLMQYGAAWEKVGRLVNLASKPNEKPGSSKVDRMRRLLIQLKNEKKQD